MKKKSKLILILLLLILLLLILYFPSTKKVSVNVTNDKLKEDIRGISFNMLGVEKESSQPHPHAPKILQFGKDSYKFTGYLQYDGTKTWFKTNQYCPRVMFEFEAKYYLVTQHYFKPAMLNLYVRDKSVLDSEFELVRDNIDISRLHYINFEVEELTRLYKFWCLRRIMQQDDIESLIRLFESYVDINPRVVFYKGANNAQEDPNIDHTSDWNALIEFLVDFEKYLMTKDNCYSKRYFDILTKILDGVTLEVRGDYINLICYHLIDINPKKAKGYLLDFYLKAEKQKKNNDSRLSYKDEVMERLSHIK